MPEGYIYSSKPHLGILALAHLKGWEQVNSAEVLQKRVQEGAMGLIIYDKEDKFPFGFIDTASQGHCFFLTLTESIKPEKIKPDHFFRFEPDSFVSQVKSLPIPQTAN